MKVWLVNDLLTAIPGTRTFWHDLLDTFGMVDCTGVPFDDLAESIERKLKENKPDVIVRNAAYFRPIDTDVRTIALAQDLKAREDVMRAADVVVYNSEYTRSHFTIPGEVIPLGTDFNDFVPGPPSKRQRDRIVWVGEPVDYPKGWDRLRRLAKTTPYKYSVVLKYGRSRSPGGDTTMHMKLTRRQMIKLYQQASLLVCTSRAETQHLSGIEAGACDVPVVASNVGVYFSRPDGAWGLRCKGEDFAPTVREAMSNLERFSPRQYWLDHGLDKAGCMRKWAALL